MIINIVGGTGIMGSLHKKVFEKHGHKVIISGRGSNPSIEEAAKQSDITIISVPVGATKETIKKVAPFCKAIADFTSMKKKPVEAMLKYSNNECEVLGLHPLYGEVESILGSTIILCRTSRTGRICDKLIKCLQEEGAKIIEMNPEEHDRKVFSINQVLRIRALTAYVKTMTDQGYSIKEMYELSPGPTKAIIELVGRQINEKNDEMYENFLKNDEFLDDIEEKFIQNFDTVTEEYIKTVSELRGNIGKEFLEELQKKAERKIS